MRKFIVISLVLAAFACNHDVKKAEVVADVNPAAEQIGNGNKVVFLGEYYQSYLSARKTGIKNTDSLYTALIQNKILNRYFSNSENAQLMQYSFYYPIQDTNGLRERMIRLYNDKEKIEKAIASALVECNKYLKNDSITLYIQPFEGNTFMQPVIKKMGGVTAITAGSKQIMLTIDPMVDGWLDKIVYTVAHEFNHTYWDKMKFK